MGRERWRLLDLEYDSPYMNLAVEEAIPMTVGKGISPSTLRFWRNTKAVVVVGRFQCVDLEVDSEACRKYGVAIVRRFTGGGAVYHDNGNLNYAISVHKDHPIISNNLESLNTRACAHLLKGVIEGLKILGLTAVFKPPRSIQINDRKISGIAGAVKWGAVFYHGTLLVNSNLNTLSEVLDVPRRRLKDKYVPSLPAKVTTLQDELGRDLSMLEVKEVLRRGFEKAQNISLVEGELSVGEKVLAQQLYEEKYSLANLTRNMAC